MELTLINIKAFYCLYLILKMNRPHGDASNLKTLFLFASIPPSVSPIAFFSPPVGL